jgi:hypothetical protein
VHWSRLLPHHRRLRPAKEGSAPSSPVPGSFDRPTFRRIISLRSRSGPQSCSPLDQAHPLRGQQRLLHPSFPHRRSPHGEVGHHYAAVWTRAAAELASAGKVLLWAATSPRGPDGRLRKWPDAMRVEEGRQGAPDPAPATSLPRQPVIFWGACDSRSNLSFLGGASLPPSSLSLALG